MNRDFRIADITRKEIKVTEPLFATENGKESYYREASQVAYSYNEEIKKSGDTSRSFVSPGKLNAVAVLHLIYQTVLTSKLSYGNEDFFSRRIVTVYSSPELSSSLSFFSAQFPSPLLEKQNPDSATRIIESMRGFFIHQVMMANSALVKAAKPFVSPDQLAYPSELKALSSVLSSYEKDDFRDGKPNTDDLFTFMTLPARLFPDSLEDQIRYITREWAEFLPETLRVMLRLTMDYIREEEKDRSGNGGGPGETHLIDYSSFDQNEYEAFSDDSNWMPKVVMMAKSTLVWLDQLSKEYKRPITTLDQIPDRELDLLAERGFTALWLIGLWERSDASRKIKNLCGNPEAEASAYSLKDYEISASIGGWQAVENLRRRCSQRGIRLASDMVPNHTGIDGNWVYEHPDYFISQDWSPFPSYTYNGPDLSSNPDFELKLEDHYYNRTDAAVTFRLTDKRNGITRYIFHGNDGTSMPWNDTAQLDYLNPETREAVIQKIIHVARNFPIIRFDAAMTLAKRHIQRLWYPKPGQGGDIAGRTSHAMSEEEFNRRIPQEFWREVVDRIAKEVPDTLLLAEAFWMMEGYFVRTLGMHRVYNSAFMNMLKNQENEKYRLSIKNTLVFEPEILKRYVNFMNNPDEDTAIAQFGDGDRYFAICTLLATLPGLPMVGHGQIEGYREKYGMEYRKAYFDERPNDYLVSEHYRRIFPLFRKRYLFSGVECFQLYDFMNGSRTEESVYAFVNGAGKERTLVLVNNQYERVSGSINASAPKLRKAGDDRSTVTTKIAESLNLTFGGRSYMLMDCFSDGLTYIVPSIQVFEEGLSFSLNGYEAKVFWNIREVEDNDGSYEKLYSEYGRNGIRNISKAVAMLRILPVHKAMRKLRNKNTMALIERIVNGKASREDERMLMLIVAEYNEMIPEVYDELEETGKNQIGDRPVPLKPAAISSFIRKISQVFSSKKSKAMPAWASLDNSIATVISQSLVLAPFASGMSIRGAMEEGDRLLLDLLYSDLASSIGFSDSDSRVITHQAALLLAAASSFDESAEDSLGIFTPIANDAGVMNLTRCNEYQGEIWYNKEEMQKAILLSALSIAASGRIKDFDADRYARELLEKEIESGYRLTVLLSRK